MNVAVVDSYCKYSTGENLMCDTEVLLVATLTFSPFLALFYPCLTLRIYLFSLSLPGFCCSLRDRFECCG
jgi:hypothetical protein